MSARSFCFLPIWKIRSQKKNRAKNIWKIQRWFLKIYTVNAVIVDFRSKYCALFLGKSSLQHNFLTASGTRLTLGQKLRGGEIKNFQILILRLPVSKVCKNLQDISKKIRARCGAKRIYIIASSYDEPDVLWLRIRVRRDGRWPKMFMAGHLWFWMTLALFGRRECSIVRVLGFM